MKPLYLAALAASFLAVVPAFAADILATTPNASGGQIVIYRAACPHNPKGLVAAAIGSNGSVIFGCAQAINHDQIMVTYIDGDTRIYAVKNFAYHKEEK